jgi:GNAT superfamily N-acetyltransferase
MAMAHSFASIARPFHAIGARLCSQRRLMRVPMRIHDRALTMRPIERGDAGLVGGLLMRLSEPTCWLRYSRPRLAPVAVQREVERMLRRDGAGAIVLLATVRCDDSAEEAVALAELMATRGETAEVAILVRDEYQGQGLGSALMAQIVRQAVSQGLRTLRFDIRRENTAMQCLVRGLGLPYRGEYWPEEICLWVDLPARSYA